jgi:subtilisin family serine protease
MVARTVVAAFVIAMSVGTAGAAVPSDPLSGSWPYAAVELPAAWAITTGSASIVIAVVDSGVDATHPDLVGAVDPGYDFVDGDADAADSTGHGTAVAGILAARANNGVGAAGACWSCRILPLRVLRPDGFAYYAVQARAIDYAVAHGAAVVNVSLYGESRDPRLEDAVGRARAAGVIVVAAAGNEGATTREYPAAFSDAISVAATVEGDSLAQYSERGEWVKVAAPACAATTQLGGGYGAGCGTSGATPLVAGVAALLRANAPFASVPEIEQALERTARPVTGIRFGRVDAFAALRALGRPAPHLTPTIVGYPYVGSVLTGYSGVWAGAQLATRIRWTRCRDAACRFRTTVGNGPTYRVRMRDRRHRLRVVVTAANVATATSAPTGLVR